MKYSTELKCRKYLENGFLSFPRKFGNKYGQKLIDIATKTRTDAGNADSKKVIQKTTGDLIGNKITDKISSLGKSKEDERKEKRQPIIDDLNFSKTLHKSRMPKNCKFA